MINYSKIIYLKFDVHLHLFKIYTYIVLISYKIYIGLKTFVCFFFSSKKLFHNGNIRLNKIWCLM